ncbi:MAG: hypothetical protein GC179_11350 [Anaerolineaceae bacterium]|nr:hypothetical protein [Anaerolineaceae bacterium]
MLWERLVLWGVKAGLISGAVVGALLGAFVGLIYGALFGLFLGGIIGTFMGLVDGILLTIITHFAYTPPNTPSRYPKLIYSVAILTNSLLIFLVCGGIDFSWAVMHLSVVDTLIRLFLLGGTPAVIMGIITAYAVGFFLEYVDTLKGYPVYGLAKR